jgi:hypothetical protein
MTQLCIIDEANDTMKEVIDMLNDANDMKLEGDIHVSGDMKVAWFKDPDGNILNITN